MHRDAPIGIYDSGIGGLTVANAVRQALPNEQLIYFGDTAHLPYGDKSTAAIQAYSVKICDILLKQGCKAVLIACNSASSAAYDLVKEYVGSRAVAVNVIDPVIDYAGTYYRGKSIGVIGTKRTIQSNIYKKKMDELGLDIDLRSLATPLLAPMIEEDFFNNKIAGNVIEEYLSQETLQSIYALILGCTHYPLIREEIRKYYQGGVEVLDSSNIVADYLVAMLKEKDLLNTGARDDDKFFVSDYTHSFEASTRLFFREQVHLEHYPLWE